MVLMTVANDVIYLSVATQTGQRQPRLHQPCLFKHTRSAPTPGHAHVESTHLLPISLVSRIAESAISHIIWFTLNLCYL